MAEAYSEARIERVWPGACNSFIRLPSLAGCGGFFGSAIPPTSATTVTTTTATATATTAKDFFEI